MGKLTNLQPRMPALAPRLGYASGDQQAESRHRRATQHWQSWYGSKRWQRLRWSILVRDQFACAQCHRRLADTSQLVCDHVEPHRGDRQRFWAGPFQTLCKTCHDSGKQIAERQARGGT